MSMLPISYQVARARQAELLAQAEQAREQRVARRRLRDQLGLTDGNLSRHLQVLEDAGYLRLRRSFEGRRPRTWVSATRAGKAALAAEVAALRQLIARLDG
jgi:DNA-binding MarR family transcriptional regulator